jgi:hypothetical protein
MNLKAWVIGLITDDEKHAELVVREQRTEEAILGLREERLKNGFGLMFGHAGLGPVPHRTRHKKKGIQQ